MRETEWACRPSDLTPPRTSPLASTYTLVVAAYEFTPPSKERSETLGFIFRKWPGGSRSTQIYLHCQSRIEHCRVPLDLLECDAIIGCSLHKLRNVGRETHIYVHHLSSLHLVNTSLPTMTFFTQENELSDLDKYLLDAIDGVLDPSIWFVGSQSYACYGGAGCGYGGTRNFCWSPQDLAPAMNKIFSILNRTCPSAPFACGLRGAFGVHRVAILRHSRETYGAMLAITEDTLPGPPLQGCSRKGSRSKKYGDAVRKEGAATWYGHAFERMWPSIFGAGTTDVRCTTDPDTILDGPPYFPPVVCRNAQLRDPTERALMQLRAAQALVPIEVESRFAKAVHKALKSPSSCVPEGAIMVSVANEQHRQLRGVAFTGVGSRNQSNCLLDRFVSLCFGFEDSIGSCVSAQPIVAAGGPSPYYHRLAWTKWHVLRIASSLATHVFFMDADVVLFENPWPALIAAAKNVLGYDVLFQVVGLGRSCAVSCPDTTGPSFVGHSSNVCSRKFIMPRSGMHRCCPTNGSQLLVARNSGLVRRVLQFQPCFRAGSVRLPLDQNISHVVRSHNFQNLQTCKLPTTFASHSEKAILFLLT